jgi:hypothetical protein
MYSSRTRSCDIQRRCQLTPIRARVSAVRCLLSCFTKLHIQVSRAMAYNPEPNDTVERLSRAVVSMLRACACDCPKSWDLRPQETVFACNTTPDSSTPVSPYSLVYGTKARLLCKSLTGSPVQTQWPNEFASHVVKRNDQALETARHAGNAKQKISIDYYDANVSSKLFKPVDVVRVRVGKNRAEVCNKLVAHGRVSVFLRQCMNFV